MSDQLVCGKKLVAKRTCVDVFLIKALKSYGRLPLYGLILLFITSHFTSLMNLTIFRYNFHSELKHPIQFNHMSLLHFDVIL